VGFNLIAWAATAVRLTTAVNALCGRFRDLISRYGFDNNTGGVLS
jgi:hypothetical protein